MKHLPLPLAVAVIALSACSTPSQVPVDSAASSSSVASAMTSGTPVSLQIDSMTVSGVLPENWGTASSPKTDQFGKIVDGPYAGGFLNAQNIDGSMQISSLVLGGYPETQLGDYSLGIPAIGLMTYPETFTDDAEDDYQAMTADQKLAILAPMIQVYNQRGIGSLQLSQTDVHATAAYRGGWWGNTAYRSDRMDVHYVESASGDLRGIAFFANEGQDWGFNPSYKIVLINPAKHLLFTAYLPLTKISEFTKFQTEIDSGSTEQDIIDAQMRGYAYLDDPANFAGTDLETFVKKADSMATSMKIQ